jgi:hypothetical protein
LACRFAQPHERHQAVAVRAAPPNPAMSADELGCLRSLAEREEGADAYHRRLRRKARAGVAPVEAVEKRDTFARATRLESRPRAVQRGHLRHELRRGDDRLRGGARRLLCAGWQNTRIGCRRLPRNMGCHPRVVFGMGRDNPR